jgi:hypothetical protein
LLVFERVGDDLASRGAGIGTHEELLEIMHRVGIKVDASIGVHPESRTCLDRAGKIQHNAARIVALGRLCRALETRSADDYHFESRLSFRTSVDVTAYSRTVPARTAIC